MAKEKKLSSSSFDAAFPDDYVENVEEFEKILPDNVKDLPDGVARLCVESRAPKCLKALLSKYPDYPINESTKKDRATALHLAAAFLPQETCRYIITCGGADDDDGCMKFDGFIQGKLIQTLLEHGANGALRDKQGDTPLDLYRRLRTLSNWETHLQLQPTIFGLLPNNFYAKHTRIKEDIERIHNLLIKAATSARKNNKKNKDPPTSNQSNSKKQKITK